MITDALAVAVGGALGTCLRWALLRWGPGAGRPPGSAFDAMARSTVAANVLGCAVFGAWISAAPDAPRLLSGPGLDPDLLVLTGICGGLTTFSTAVADGVRLGGARGGRSALAYAAITCSLGLAALWIGARAAG